ncbi:hypothetical protein ITP53_25930 [Nonomuraea sp. K274]|uniref:Uncharacterized protein n=1 Tax=Nonomuraea cypriaca TaxID=1187855 RepID=A0A931F078_9ACTN|nr:hypothetical protein [Nonomuraea cypriaca]MBF8189110.1 hypothetical protein [Nonomuraea cypriaca]
MKTSTKACKHCTTAYEVPARRGRTKDFCSDPCRTTYRRAYKAEYKRDNGSKCEGCLKTKFMEEYERTCSPWCSEVVKLMEGYDGVRGLTREQAVVVADAEGWPKVNLPHRPRINDLEQLQRYELAPVIHEDGGWSHGDYRIITCDSDFESYDDNAFGVRDWIADDDNTPYARLARDPEATAWLNENKGWHL